MAKYTLNPNPYSKTLSRKFNRNFFLLVSAVSGIALAYWLSENTSLFLALVGYLVLFLFIATSYKIFIRMGKNDRGEIAETKVKNILVELPDSYSIYQNVLIKEKLDIDFVLIGPHGIFAIEVKSHRAISFFSKRRHINQAFAEAMGLKEYLQGAGLKAYVHPVLVYTSAQTIYDPRRNGVCVTSHKDLLIFVYQAKRHVFDRQKTEDLVQKLIK
jgi:hypothetical protein